MKAHPVNSFGNFPVLNALKPYVALKHQVSFAPLNNLLPRLRENLMSDGIIIYINPACTKCRLSLELLEENKVNATVIEYLNTPPDKARLSEILDLLHLEPRELMRKFEAPYKDNNLDDENLSRDQLIQAMIDNPILIERPIVINGDKATIGRPPEKILDIL